MPSAVHPLGQSADGRCGPYLLSQPGPRRKDQAHRARLESTVRPSRWNKSPDQAEAFGSVQGQGRAEGLHLQSLPAKPVIHRQLGRVLRTTQGAPSSHTDPSPLHSGPSHWPVEVCVCEAPCLGAPGLRADTHPGASGEQALEGDSCSPLCCPWSLESSGGPVMGRASLTGHQGH